MGSSVQQFANKAEAGVARTERLFNRLTPGLSSATKQFLQFATTAAITAGIIGGITFSFTSLKDYETSVQSFRTIVSDLNDTDFSKYEKAIQDVARETKKSTIDTAKAFEMIAGLNAKFAETPDSISAVTVAAITLAKASRDDLGKSASNLTGILNQFNLQAKEADRVINVLAAGQAVGASTITQTADAFTVFGAVAKSSNLTLEQSTALVEVLASKQIQGAEAGTALRGSMLALQKAGLGYKSGMFNMRDAMEEVNQKLAKLKTAKEKDALMTDVFGVINRTAGTILVNNVALYDEFTKSVTGTSEAQKAAAINSDTLSVAIEEGQAAWINYITSSDNAAKGLNVLKKTIKFVTNNLDTIVSIGTKVLLFFLTWKALIIAAKVGLIAYNIAFGIYNALQQRSLFYTEGNVYAKYADLTVTKLMTASQWLLNAAMSANPIGLFIALIVALVAIIVVAIKHYNEWGAALLMFLGPLGFVVNLIQSFRRNWDMITKAFQTGGILEGFKAIGKTILDAILMPLQQVMKIIADVTGADWAKSAMNNIEQFRKDMGVNVTTDENGQPLESTPALASSMQKAITQKIESTNNARVAIDVNDPNKRTSVSSNNDAVKINLSSTLGWGQ
jgi:TP901 family phage tail tape measure protein